VAGVLTTKHETQHMKTSTELKEITVSRELFNAITTVADVRASRAENCIENGEWSNEQEAELQEIEDEYSKATQLMEANGFNCFWTISVPIFDKDGNEVLIKAED